MEDNLGKCKVRLISIVAPTSFGSTTERIEPLHDQPVEPPQNTLDKRTSYIQEKSCAENLGSLVYIQNLNKTIQTLQETMQSLQVNLSQLASSQAMTEHTHQNSNIPPVSFLETERVHPKDSLESKKAFLNEQLQKRMKEQQTQLESLQLNETPWIPLPPPFPVILPDEPIEPANLPNVSQTPNSLESPIHPTKISPTDAFRGELNSAILQGGLTLRKTKLKAKETKVSDGELQSSETKFRNTLKPLNKIDLSATTEFKAAEPNQRGVKEVSPIIEEIRKRKLERRQSMSIQVPNLLEKLDETQIADQLKPPKKRNPEAKKDQSKFNEDENKFAFPFSAKLRSVANKPSWCTTNESSNTSSKTENQNNKDTFTNGNVPFTQKLRPVEKPFWCVQKHLNENKENCALEHQQQLQKKPETSKKPLPPTKPMKSQRIITADESYTTSSKTNDYPDSSLCNASVMPPPPPMPPSIMPPPPPMPPSENMVMVKPNLADDATALYNDRGDLFAAIQGFNRDSLKTPNKKSTHITKKPTDMLPLSVNGQNVLLSQIQGFERSNLKNVTKCTNKSCTTDSSTNLNISKIMASALQNRFRALNGKTNDDSDSDKEDTDQINVSDEDEWAENIEE